MLRLAERRGEEVGGGGRRGDGGTGAALAGGGPGAGVRGEMIGATCQPSTAAVIIIIAALTSVFCGVNCVLELDREELLGL